MRIDQKQIEAYMSVDEFKRRVTAFKQAKLDHHKTVGVPAPSEHHLVVAAVKRVPKPDRDDWVEDYQIVEPAPKSLPERKKDLIVKVTEQYNILMNASLPAGSRMLDQIKADDIAEKEERTADEKLFMANRMLRMAKEGAYYRHLAQMCHEIEGLTEETIDKWMETPFPSEQPKPKGFSIRLPALQVPTLEEKKARLRSAFSRQYFDKLDAVMSQAKRRLDQAKANELMSKPEGELTANDKKYLVSRRAQFAKEAKWEEHYALILDQIDNLTEETIGLWQPAPFPS